MIHIPRGSLQRGLIVVAVLSLLTIVPSANAQTPPPSGSSVEIVGMVRAMTATTLRVNGLIVDIHGAQIRTTLRIGLKVKVQGIMSATGTVVAREVLAAGIQDRIRTQLRDCTQTPLQDCLQLQDRTRLQDRTQTQQQDRAGAGSDPGQGNAQGSGTGQGEGNAGRSGRR
jgi:hypothetical protein